MTSIGALPRGPSGHAPAVRPAYRILERAHASVAGLFEAVDVLDTTRRQGNLSKKGRKSKVEVDVIRSAIVLSSAGLDASMKRLVNDVGRVLAVRAATGARHEFEEHLKREMQRPSIAPSFQQAVLGMNVDDQLLAHYLADRTKASFQGSNDLRVRVRQTLGISKSDVPDADIAVLDDFFLARNKISHDMDLKDPASGSIAREHRDPAHVAQRCAEVFDVAVRLINGAAKACKKGGL